MHLQNSYIKEEFLASTILYRYNVLKAVQG